MLLHPSSYFSLAVFGCLLVSRARLLYLYTAPIAHLPFGRVHAGHAVRGRCGMLSHDRLSASFRLPAVAPIWIRSVFCADIRDRIVKCEATHVTTRRAGSPSVPSASSSSGWRSAYPPAVMGFISYVHLSDLPRSSNTRTSAAAAAAAGRPAAQRAGGQADWRAPTRRRRQTSLQR